MKRILCIRLPSWPIQRLVVAQPKLGNRVIILHSRESGGGQCVVACSRAAYRYGIRPRMSLAEAVALQETGMAAELNSTLPRAGARDGASRSPPSPERHADQDASAVSAGGVSAGPRALASSIEGERDGRSDASNAVAKPESRTFDPDSPYIAEHQPQADAEELERLAEWCECFSPVVGFESLDRFERASGTGQRRNDCLYLDLTHVSAYFGNETRLARLVAESFSRRGYLVRIAVADTLGAAWACARFVFQAATVLGRRDDESTVRGLYVSQNTMSAASPPQGRTDRIEHLSNRRTPSDSGIASTEGKASASSSIETPSSSFVVVPAEGTFTVLRSLPVQSLRLPRHIYGLLKRLGIFQLAQLACLPRASLVSRFGKILLERWDQTFGRIDEVLIAHRPPPSFQTDWTVEHATTNRAVIQSILGTLIERLAGELRGRGKGIIQCTCRLTCQKPFQDLSCNDGSPAPVFLRIGLSRPTTCVDHLQKLVEMRLERLKFPGPVQRIVLEASQIAPLACRQRQLFSEPTRHPPGHLNQLLDRLSSGLGVLNVVRVRLCPEAQPELAYHEVPLTPSDQSSLHEARGARKRSEKRMHGGSPGHRGGGAFRSRGQGEETNQWDHCLSAAKRSSSPTADVQPAPLHGRLIRPLHLRSPPLALAVVALAPEGPPSRLLFGNRSYRVARYWGPERIETGWWRGRMVCRDYYRVETGSGHWLWVFRQLTDGNWFLHGTFG